MAPAALAPRLVVHAPVTRLHWRTAAILALSMGLWLAAAVRPAPGTVCTPMLSAHKGAVPVCTCPNCPGGAHCCCLGK